MGSIGYQILRCVVGAVFGLSLAHAAEAEPPPIRKVSELRATEAPAGNRQAVVPVAVRGIVSWTRGSPVSVFAVMDDSAGIYVNAAAKTRDAIVGALRTGMEVELEGDLIFSGFAPYIRATSVKVLGEKSLPEPPVVTSGALLGGILDSQRVAVKAIVEAVLPDPMERGMRVLSCIGIGGHFTIRLPTADWNEPERLIDAAITARGLVITLCNTRKEVTGAQLSVTRPEDLIVEKPPPAAPFAAQRRRLGLLLPFSTRGYQHHRCVVTGTVTYVSAKEFFIQDNDQAVRVERWTGEAIHVGDRVEVAAFVEHSKLVANLHDALVRKTNGDNAIAPVPTSPDAILRSDRDHAWRGWESLASDFDGRLVKLKGRVLASNIHQIAQRAVRSNLELLVRSDSGASVECELPPDTVLPSGIDDVGSDLELTGIVRLEYGLGEIVPDYVQPQSVRLLLRSAEDLHLIQPSPYWTRERLGYVTTGFGSLVLLLGGWTWGLNRHLKKQAFELARHHAAEAEHRATVEERARLAGDFHDGVQQVIAGTSLHLENARHALPANVDEACESLDTARHLVVRIRDEMRRSIWALRELDDMNGCLALGLEKLVADQRTLVEAEIELLTEGQSKNKLPQAVITAFVLTAQEAIANAVKHGKAEHIKILLKHEPTGITMSVVDDGGGFDTSQRASSEEGHFGLASMLARLIRIGGTLAITSTQGAGTSVVARLPLPAD